MHKDALPTLVFYSLDNTWTCKLINVECWVRLSYQNMEWTWLVGALLREYFVHFPLVGSYEYFLPVSTGLNIYAPVDMYHGFNCRNACGMARTYRHFRKREFRLSLTKRAHQLACAMKLKFQMQALVSSYFKTLHSASALQRAIHKETRQLCSLSKRNHHFWSSYLREDSRWDKWYPKSTRCSSNRRFIVEILNCKLCWALRYTFSSKIKLTQHREKVPHRWNSNRMKRF